MKSVGWLPNCTRINSTPIWCRTFAGMAARSSRLEPRNSSGLIGGAVGFFGFTRLTISIPAYSCKYLYSVLVAIPGYIGHGAEGGLGRQGRANPRFRSDGTSAGTLHRSQDIPPREQYFAERFESHRSNYGSRARSINFGIGQKRRELSFLHDAPVLSNWLSICP